MKEFPVFIMGLAVGVFAILIYGTLYRTADIGCWEVRVEDEGSKQVTCIYPGMEIGKARTFWYDCSMGWKRIEKPNGDIVIQCRKPFRTLNIYKVDINPANVLIRWEDCLGENYGQTAPSSECVKAFQKQYDECYLDVSTDIGIFTCCKDGACIPI